MDKVRMLYSKVEPMKRLIVLGALMLAACGGSPAAPTPTPPVPTPIPPASIVSTGGGSFSVCNQFGCIFNGPMRNSGTGCANTVKGTVTFFDAQQAGLGTFQWSIAAATVVRAGESFVFTTSLLSAALQATATYRVDPAWTDVRCS